MSNECLCVRVCIYVVVHACMGACMSKESKNIIHVTLDYQLTPVAHRS